MFSEAKSEEDKEAKAAETAKELTSKLHMYQSKGFKDWEDSSEGKKYSSNKKVSTIISSCFTGAGALCFALAGVTLPVIAIYVVAMEVINHGTNAIADNINKKYVRNYSKSDIAKIKHYADKANSIADDLEKKAAHSEDDSKKKKLMKTAKEYRELAKKFESECKLVK